MSSKNYVLESTDVSYFSINLDIYFFHRFVDSS